MEMSYRAEVYQIPVRWKRTRNVAVNIRQSIGYYGHADTHPNHAGL